MSSEATELLSKLRDFCNKYFKSKLSSKQKKELCRQFNQFVPQICGKICEQLNSEVLDNEPNVIPVEGLCYVFGDIHGNLEDVYDYEIKLWNNDNNKDAKFVFLGDFVDRGAFSTEVSLYLFSLKLLEPKRFILVRGNHEIRSVNKKQKKSFYDECLNKYGKKLGNTVWDDINKCFERLPLAAAINNKVFCCHGGVPKSATSVKEIEKIPKPLDEPSEKSPVAHELLWNDPIEALDGHKTQVGTHSKYVRFELNSGRQTGYYFTALAAKEFLDTNGFSHMIRAHECVRQGHRWTSDDLVLTIFSSSKYSGDNIPVCAKVTVGSPTIEIIQLK